MNTLLDVINKYSLSDEIGVSCAQDQYLLRNKSVLEAISENDLNELKYSTILQMVTNQKNSIKILKEWKGTRTYLLYRNIIKDNYRDSDVMSLVREDILKNENPVKLVIEICETISLTEIEMLFMDGDSDESLLVKIANDELIRYLIEHERVIDDVLLDYDGYMPKSLFNILYKNIEAYLAYEDNSEYSFYSSPAFYDYINSENVYKNHITFRSLITGKCCALKTHKAIMEFFLEVESKHPRIDILNYVDGTPYSVFHIYRCYRYFNVKSKTDVNYELVVNLSYPDLIMLKNVYTTEVDKIMTHTNFMLESEIDVKLKLNLLKYIIEKFGIFKNIEVLEKFFELNMDKISKISNISFMMQYTNKYEKFFKFAFMYPIEDIIDFINQDRLYVTYVRPSIEKFTIKLLDYVLSVDRENYKKINFKKLRDFDHV